MISLIRFINNLKVSVIIIFLSSVNFSMQCYNLQYSLKVSVIQTFSLYMP